MCSLKKHGGLSELAVGACYNRFSLVLGLLASLPAAARGVVCPSHVIHMFLAALIVSDIQSLGTEVLLAFVEAGGNVVVAASEESARSAWALGDFLEESGVQLAPEGRRVIDHVNAADPAGDHSVVLASGYVPSHFVVGDSAKRGPVVFKGISQSFNAENYLAIPVLTASETAYAANPSKVWKLCLQGGYGVLRT